MVVPIERGLRDEIPEVPNLRQPSALDNFDDRVEDMSAKRLVFAKGYCVKKIDRQSNGNVDYPSNERQINEQCSSVRCLCRPKNRAI
jgi:hypothetical protein